MCILLHFSVSVYKYFVLIIFLQNTWMQRRSSFLGLLCFLSWRKADICQTRQLLKRSYYDLYCLFVPQMRRHSCFVFLFCGIFLPGILGFPQTNTSIDCDSLLPNYEAEPQTSAPPYIIAVSFDNFEPGNEVQGKQSEWHKIFDCVFQNYQSS